MIDVAAAVAGMEEQSARQARAVLDWLLPEDDDQLSDLTQARVQMFLWYELPTKWLTEDSELHEIAWSSGDLLAAHGMHRYAEICRDPQTHLIIDAWQGDDTDAARTMFRHASEESGVEPPDTDLLAWGTIMGIQEASIRNEVSTVLERAILRGDIVVGDRGWKKAAARVTSGFLTSAFLRTSGMAPVDVIHEERAENWANAVSETRRRVLAPVVPLLTGPEPKVPPDAAQSLAAVVALLEAVGDGVTMTQAGYLPKALVVELNDRFGWFDLPGFSVRTETDVAPIADLHRLLRGARLLTKRRRTLSLSAQGRRCLADPDLLWRTVARQLLSGSGFDADAAAATVAVLLSADGRVGESDLYARAHGAVVGRWRTAAGEQVDVNAVRWGARDWVCTARTLGWLDEAGRWPQPREIGLTAAGPAGAVCGLRTVAFAPSCSPYG